MSAVMEDTKSQATTEAKTKRPPTEYTEVKMTDGRIVKFAGKTTLMKEALKNEKDEFTGEVRFDFSNGETRSFVAPDSLLIRFIAHGIAQKIGDETAGTKGVDDKVVQIDAIIEQLSKGEWGAGREAGDGFAGASIVIRAIMEASGKDQASVKAFLNKKLDDAKAKGEKLSRAELYNSFKKSSSKTGQIIARMEQEARDKEAVVDADATLAELEGQG